MADNNNSEGGGRNGRQMPAPRRENAVDLHNSGSLKAGRIIEQSLGNLTAEQKQALMGKAAEKGLEIEAESIRMARDEVRTRKGIEDHIDAWNNLDKTGKLTRHEITTEINSSHSNTKIKSASGVGSPCFVATAAYGGANHRNVEFLRRFRDTHLVRSAGGRRFIDWYWEVGPKLAVPVMRSRTLQRISRAGLDLLIGALRLVVSSGERSEVEAGEN